MSLTAGLLMSPAELRSQGSWAPVHLIEGSMAETEGCAGAGARQAQAQAQAQAAQAQLQVRTASHGRTSQALPPLGRKMGTVVTCFLMGSCPVL